MIDADFEKVLATSKTVVKHMQLSYFAEAQLFKVKEMS